MPIRYEKRYDPAFCRAHPDWLIVFGDNFARYGKAGQAVIRHEHNAVGIPTKRRPAMADDAFLTDADLPLWGWRTGKAVGLLRRRLEIGGTVVLPEDGLGTGLAQLPTRAPAIWAQLQKHLDALKAIAPSPFLLRRPERWDDARWPR